MTSAQTIQRSAALSSLPHRPPDGGQWPQVEGLDRLLLFANAQNLVSRWNNIITAASTGEEQLRWMGESGVFAPDVALDFILPGDERLSYSGLASARPFYEQFVDGLCKERLNIAANVEVLEFLEDGLRFRFRHFILLNGRVSLSGYNHATLERRDGRLVITRASIHVVLFDMEHGYRP